MPAVLRIAERRVRRIPRECAWWTVSQRSVVGIPPPQRPAYPHNPLGRTMGSVADMADAELGAWVMAKVVLTLKKVFKRQTGGPSLSG